MNERVTYSVASPNIVFQEISGEAIILDLEKGYYYSLRYSGAPIWEALVADKLTVPEAVERLLESYSSTKNVVGPAVEGLVSTLLKENLIIEDAVADAPKVKSKNIDPKAAKKTFGAPAFEKYTDMQQLLVMDPIHEIDPSAGWPKKAGA
jgi:hypothetical protein